MHAAHMHQEAPITKLRIASRKTHALAYAPTKPLLESSVKRLTQELFEFFLALEGAVAAVREEVGMAGVDDLRVAIRIAGEGAEGAHFLSTLSRLPGVRQSRGSSRSRAPRRNCLT